MADEDDDAPDFSVMNIEDFLNENNIDMDDATNDASSIASPRYPWIYFGNI